MGYNAPVLYVVACEGLVWFVAQAVLSGFELEWRKQRKSGSSEKWPGDLLQAPVAINMCNA